MPLNLGSRWLNTGLGCAAMPVMLRVFLLALLLVQSSVFAQDGTVQSKLSANTITRDETVTLEITAIGMDAELDLSSLQKDFEVTGRSSSREIRSIMEAGSGLRTTSIVTWAVELVPREVGLFTVPPVRVGNVRSQAHTLAVTELPTGAGRDVFVEATVDTETPWVQSQVLMTLKVFLAVDILNASLSVPDAENLVVETLGQDVVTQEIHGGRKYDVTTRQFALFPQKSGELILEPITLNVSVPADPSRVRSFFSPSRKLSRRTDKIVLTVKPRPNTDSTWWLPAKAVQLNSQWVGDVSSATVDQPLTRNVVLRASGVTDSQLPEINLPAIEGASLYAEEPERKLGANQQGVVSELTIKWAVIPQRVGEIVLPAVSMDWFNTSTGRVETAVLPAETITVGPAQNTAQLSNSNLGAGQGSMGLTRDGNASNTQSLASSNSTSTGSDQNVNAMNGAGKLDSENTPAAGAGQVALQLQLQKLESSVVMWRNSAMIILALWLLSTLAFLVMRFGRQKSAEDSNASDRLGAVRNVAAESLSRMQPLGSVSASCKLGSPAEIRHALLEWSVRQWPVDPPLTLGALSKRFAPGAARDSIESLDAALYSKPDEAEELALLKTRLASLPEQLKAAVSAGELKNNATNQSGQVISTKGLPAL